MTFHPKFLWQRLYHMLWLAAISSTMKRCFTYLKNTIGLIALFCCTLLTQGAYASNARPRAGGGLQKVHSLMDTLKTELLSLIPGGAVLALVAMGIGYALKMVSKDAFIRWGIGLAIAGSAAQIVNTLIM